MSKTAVILAGGLGTRLKSIVNEVPKPMADINGKPFLFYLLTYLKRNNIEEVILSVGYKHHIISNYFGSNFKGISIKYSIEKEPLGTGGGIKKSLQLSKEENIFILNGDTLFSIDFQIMRKFHNIKKSKLTIALRKKEQKDRYGSVEIDSKNQIKDFGNEKGEYINGGIYLINKKKFLSIDFSEKFSFESDFIKK